MTTRIAPTSKTSVSPPKRDPIPGLPGPVTMTIVLGMLSAFGPLSLDTYLPGLPDLQRDFGTSASQAQLTLSACLLGLATGQLVAGPLSDRFGRHKPLLVGIGLFALMSFLCALAPTIEALIGIRYLQGAAGGSGIVIARATVRDLHEGTAAARFFSRLMLVNGLAPILAPILGGQLLKVTDWRGVFVVLGFIGIGLFLIAAFFLPETLMEDRRQPGGLRQTVARFGDLLRDKVFVGYALTMGFGGAALFGYIASSPFVLQDIYGLSPQRFSLVFGSIAIGYVTMSQVNARLVGRMPLRTLLKRGLILFALSGAAVLAGVLIDRGLLLVLIPLYTMMASLGFIYPNATALALNSYPQTAGSASSLLGLAQFAFGALAAPLVGISGEDTAVPMAIVIATATSGAFLAFTLLTRSGTE